MQVTDHALVRWLERVHGIDVEFFRRAIAETPGLREAAEAGCSAYARDGVTFLLRDGAVTTIMEGHGKGAGRRGLKIAQGRQVRARDRRKRRQRRPEAAD